MLLLYFPIPDVELPPRPVSQDAPFLAAVRLAFGSNGSVSQPGRRVYERSGGAWGAGAGVVEVFKWYNYKLCRATANAFGRVQRRSLTDARSEVAMVQFTLVGLLLLALAPLRVPARANMLHIRVTAAHVATLRAIWHPRAGVIGTTVEDQQRPLLNPLGVRPPADSLRRWRDAAARDSVTASTPVEFVVDMSHGPVRIEVISPDTVEIEAQLAPGRGPIMRLRGRAFDLEADGREPSIHPRP